MAQEMALLMMDPIGEVQEATMATRRAEEGTDIPGEGRDIPSAEVGEDAGADEAGIHPAVVGEDIHEALALPAPLQPSYGASRIHELQVRQKLCERQKSTYDLRITSPCRGTVSRFPLRESGSAFRPRLSHDE